MTQTASRTQAKATVAMRRVESYRKRFGDGHIYLACYAALPLALTPDLLYRLWANFQRDGQGELLEIPWIAVSDLLLSNLCNEVGEELYEMEDVVREVLLKQLRSRPQLGEARLQEVAEFVLAYVEPQLNNPDSDVRDLVEVQQWRSLAYVEPEAAARSIALRLAQLDHWDKSEWLRMARLVEPLSKPLAEFGALADYTRGMAAFVRGRTVEAKEQLRKALGANHDVEVAGVKLTLPTELRSALQPKISTVGPKQSLPSFLLENSRWLGVGTALLVMVGGGVYWWRSPSIDTPAQVELPVIVTSNGQPLEAAEVTILTDAPPVSLKTNSNGYVAAEINPNGKLIVEIRKSGYTSIQSKLNIADLSKGPLTFSLKIDQKGTTCFGDSCAAGRLAQSTKCFADATNFDYATGEKFVGGQTISDVIRIEMRYSKNCDSVWARAVAPKGSQIYMQDENMNKINSYVVPDDNSREHHIEMISKNSPTRACVLNSQGKKETTCTAFTLSNLQIDLDKPMYQTK
jgi:hypothetical protein